MTMSEKGWIGWPSSRAARHFFPSGQPGPRTLVSRTTAVFGNDKSSPSASAFCRPYSLFGETGSIAPQQAVEPSKTRLVERKTTKAPSASSRLASSTVRRTLMCRVPAGSCTAQVLGSNGRTQVGSAYRTGQRPGLGIVRQFQSHTARQRLILLARSENLAAAAGQLHAQARPIWPSAPTTRNRLPRLVSGTTTMWPERPGDSRIRRLPLPATEGE